MSNKKVSGLPSGAPAQLADEILVARSGVSYKLSLSDLDSLIGGGGGGSGTLTLNVYNDGVDFTGGVTTSLALPVDAVSEQNLWVYYNGLFQESTEWTLTTGVSPSVDFSSPIPNGVTRVEVRIYQP
jgi:hypothetical protein